MHRYKKEFLLLPLPLPLPLPLLRTMLLRRCYSVLVPSPAPPPQRAPPLPCRPFSLFRSYLRFFCPSSPALVAIPALSFSSSSGGEGDTSDGGEVIEEFPSKKGLLKPGLYLVGTPIGNLEDITLRALRVLRSADVILSEDTRHSGKLLQYYKIRTPLLSYHKFNESQREQVVLRRLQIGEIVALITDAGMPGISDPGMELARLCVEKDIPVVPIPGPSAPVAALSASCLPTEEFTFVGFLPKHATKRRERLLISANNPMTQVFFVPPHKLCQFLEETHSVFGEFRRCVIAREMTKLHEEFWRGTLGEAKEAFSIRQPKGEITFLIEGMRTGEAETVSESQLGKELEDLLSKGHSLSMAVKLVSTGTSMKRKAIYSLALEKFGSHEKS